MRFKIMSKYWYVRNTLYIVIYAFIALFLYDFVAHHPIRNPTTLFSPLDYHIPFVSLFALFYVFVFYPFFIFTFGYFMYVKPERSNQFFISLLIIYAVSYAIYVVFPVMMIRPDPSELPKDFLGQVMARYYEVDPPLNCFPSLHAALSTITAYYLSKEKPRFEPAFWGIAFMVMLSTLFVRQHVIVDEIAGFLLAIGAGIVSQKYVPPEQIPPHNMNLRIWFTVILATIITILSISKFLPL